MPFPVSPAVNTLHTIPTGSVYRYNSKGAWQLSKIGRGYLPETGRLSLAPDVMPTMIVGAAFSQAVTASGGTGPYTYALAGGAFPAGLTMTTGTISGTPTTAGPYAFTIRATDSTGGTPLTVERDYSGQVQTSAISILPDSISGLLVGKPYSQTFTASGGTAPYTWAVITGALPAGLSLVAGTGVVSGTPTTAGAFAFTLRATDAASKIGTKAYGGVVAGNLLTITPTKLPQLIVSSAIAVQFTASGGTAPYTWDIQTGTLPAGLSLNAGTGLISGTPTTAGSYSFTLRATDTFGQTGAVALSGTILDAIGKIWNGHYYPYVPRRLRYRVSDSKFTMLSAQETNFTGQGPSYVHSSADGITWSLEQQLPFSASFHETLNGKAVVAGANAIWIDGVASSLPTRAQIYAAAGVDVSTIQGENWQGSFPHIFSVAYGGGFYVAVGAMILPMLIADGGGPYMHSGPPYQVPFILRSTNSSGAIFQAQTTPPFMLSMPAPVGLGTVAIAVSPVEVVYAFSKFVLMNNTGFAYSTSGASGTWTASTSITGPEGKLGAQHPNYGHMKLVNNILFAFGHNEPGTTEYNVIPYISQDGVGWQALRSNFPKWMSDIAHNGNFYVASGAFNIGTSTNLNTWNAQPLAPLWPQERMGNVAPGHLINAAPAGGKFVSAFSTGYDDLVLYNESWDTQNLGSGYVLTSYP